MKNNSRIYLFLLILFIISNLSLWGQPKMQKGFKFGTEILHSLSANAGSFDYSPGFTIGAFTGINIHSGPSGSWLIKLELNYVRIQHYNVDDKFYGVDKNSSEWNGQDYSLFDEYFKFNFIEFGFIPEYSLKMSQNSGLGIFLGPSFGLGSRKLTLKKKDSNPVTSTPYFDYNMGFALPISVNLGVSYYYNILVFDVRFRYSYLTGSSGLTDLTNLYVQFGFVL